MQESSAVHTRSTPAFDMEDRLKFLGFEPEDAARLRAIVEIIEPRIPEIVDAFYAHMGVHPDLRPFFSDEALMNRLRLAQSNYLVHLGQGYATSGYFDDRYRIGVVHERIGVEFKWFLGAYAQFFRHIVKLLDESRERGQFPVLTLCAALYRIFSLDASIAIEAYHKSTTERLEHLVGELKHTQRALLEAAQLDDLTGIGNRRYLSERLGTEIRRARRFGHELSILMIDLDHFKRVNDQYGHAVGDQVLRHFVRIAQESLRDSDLFGRYGGEEFVAALIECDAKMAMQVAERIRASVESSACETGDGELSITVSIGVAQSNESCSDADRLLNLADQALYRAKEGGRNQVRLAPGSR